MWKARGKKPAELEIPERPAELEYLWLWYGKLRSHERLTWTEIDSWARLTGIRPTAVEAEALWALDRINWSVR